MLFSLDANQVVVGKKVHVRGRPDVAGVIIEVKDSTYYYNGGEYHTISVRVLFSRSRRVSKWKETYSLCDLDKYYEEISKSYSQTTQMMVEAEQSYNKYKKQQGDVS